MQSIIDKGMLACFLDIFVKRVELVPDVCSSMKAEQT